MRKKINTIKIDKHPVLGEFLWENIPMLSVITGVNGSGKTKLLDAIAMGITEGFIRDPRTGLQTATIISVTPKPTRHAFFFVRAQQNVGSLGRIEMAQFGQEFEGFINGASLGHIRADNNEQQWRIIDYIQKKTGENSSLKPQAYYESEKFKRNYLDAWTYLNDVASNQHINRLFLNYQIKMADAVTATRKKDGQSISDQDLFSQIGEPPWELINKLFEKYNFRYRINHPTSVGSNLTIKFSAIDEGVDLLYEQLSSGEQMIVNLVFWSFDPDLAQHRELILMDEPDAHLHPELGLMFKEIVTDLLIKKLGIQVIMTTHSPTTLCWFDEASIFLFEKKKGIRQTSKDEAMHKLTSGLVMIHESLRIVLVEDQFDQFLYQRTFDLLVLNRLIPRSVQLSFRSVTQGDVTSGGRSNVISSCNSWEAATKVAPEINSLVLGLVDNDTKPDTDLGNSTKALPRYCLENFLADPLLIFALMVDNGEPVVAEFANSVGYTKGDQHLFKTNKMPRAQEIADFMSSLLGAKIASETTVKLKYVNGISIEVPNKFISLSGKDELLKFWRETFLLKQSSINIGLIMNEMERCLLIPLDLVETFRGLQSP